MSKKLKPTKGHEIGKIQDLRQLLDRAKMLQIRILRL